VLCKISESRTRLAAILRPQGSSVEIVETGGFAIMRFRTALSVAAFFLLCFTVAVWSSPLDAQDSMKTGTAAETQTVSGKIASMGDAEFSVEVREGEKPGKRKFLIDGDTKVEVRLSIGAHATVEYRLEGDTNIATHVSVLETSGIESH